MKLKIVMPVLLVVALASGCAVSNDGTRAKHVFIVSFDQGVPEIMQESEMPTVKKMVAEGASSWEAFTIVPSSTLPAHASMLTGVGIQKHQVLWNDWIPTNGMVKVPTVFSLAKENGLTTAMFVGKEKFKHLNTPGSIDVFAIPGDARSVAETFAAEFPKLKPNLCFIHFADPDGAGHKEGVGSSEQFTAFADCDAALKVIKDAIAASGLADSSVFILTADHGGHNITNRQQKIVGTHGSPHATDVLIPWIAWGKGVKKDFKITAPVVTYDTAATALWLLGMPLPESFWGRPVESAFEQPRQPVQN